MKKNKLLIILTLLTILMVNAACRLPSRKPDSTPVPISTEAAEQFEENLESAAESFQTSESITVTLTQEEITSYIVSNLPPDLEFEVTDLQIFLNNDQIEVYGNVDQGMISADAKIVIKPNIDAYGQIRTEIIEFNVGPFPISQSMKDNLSAQIDDAIMNALQANDNDIIVKSIDINNGQMIITASKG